MLPVSFRFERNRPVVTSTNSAKNGFPSEYRFLGGLRDVRFAAESGHR
jgi:hypothetical protein